MNAIDVIANEVIEKVNSDGYDKYLLSSLQKMLHRIQLEQISTKKRAKGYCSSFSIPETEVLAMFNGKFGSGFTDKVVQGFTSAWNLPPDTKMYSNPYYLLLMLIVLVGAKIGNDSLASAALSLICFRLWNGRLIKSWLIW
jgi:hypothetical protein